MKIAWKNKVLFHQRMLPPLATLHIDYNQNTAIKKADSHRKGISFSVNTTDSGVQNTAIEQDLGLKNSAMTISIACSMHPKKRFDGQKEERQNKGLNKLHLLKSQQSTDRPKEIKIT